MLVYKYQVMKKNGIIILGAFFLFVAFAALACREAEAKITGDCEACHGLYPGMLESAPGGPLKFVLQNALCVDCHTNSTRDTLKHIGQVDVPVVFNHVEPVKPLAGGNFYYVSRDFGDRYGHNVDGIAPVDRKHNGAPPGYDRQSDPSVIGYNPGKTLACSGSNGCHGDRNIEDPFKAIMKNHHAEDRPIDGSTTARSYRFLKITGKEKGVTGIEDDEWERNRSPKKHNEYTSGINRLCANCHGDLHGSINTGKESPWLRHPTGVILPERGEYLKYNPDDPPPPGKTGERIYSTEAPVARGSLTSDLGEIVRPGSDSVFCLSCHMAHAGPYKFSLRWDYDAVTAGEAGKGACFICHTEKGE